MSPLKQSAEHGSNQSLTPVARVFQAASVAVHFSAKVSHFLRDYRVKFL